MRARRTLRVAHRVTTAHFQAAYPFVAESGLGARGVFIGRDLWGGSVCYDPWEQYQRGLQSPNMLVFGMIGHAKSSLVKTYVWRQLVFGRTAWIVDPKGEYDRLCHAAGVAPIRFVDEQGQVGTTRLNPLDPRISPAAQLALLRSVAAVLLGRKLKPQEDSALERAHAEALATARSRGREPVVALIVEHLLRPPARSAEALATSVEQLAHEGREVAMALRRLFSGDLAGMFDGPTSAHIRLDGPLVSFNLAGVPPDALPILMTCTAAWLQAAWARNDGRRRIVVLDEAWYVLRHLEIAQWLRASWKLARQFGVQMVAVTHRLSDLSAAGHAGSEQVQLARGLLEDSETRVIYRQPPGELEAARALFGLTQTEVETIPTLERGEALWRVGKQAMIVRHIIAPRERYIVDTDANMRASTGDVKRVP